MNVSLMVGASPVGDGTSTGLMAVFATPADSDAAALTTAGLGFAGSPVALARSVRPSARPVRSGSIPYSAGRTNATRMTPAHTSATTVAIARERSDGTW